MMLPTQATTHHPRRAPEATRPLRREGDPARNEESERYAGFDLLPAQAVDEQPRERHAKKQSKQVKKKQSTNGKGSK
jgi:hypothetical protein